MPPRDCSPFEALDDISIVAAPGSTLFVDIKSRTIIGTLISHCERMRYRIAVNDCAKAQTISNVRAMRGQFDSSYAAFYYPWVRILDPLTGRGNYYPPSGLRRGHLRAQRHRTRGLQGAGERSRQPLGRLRDSAQQGPSGSAEPGGGQLLPLLRGARQPPLGGAHPCRATRNGNMSICAATSPYLEHSIDKGTQWAVFEPNGERLWANVRSTIADFLLNEWQNGALLGDKPEKSFFVKCDRSTMSQNDLDNGRLVCLIGVRAAPSRRIRHLPHRPVDGRRQELRRSIMAVLRDRAYVQFNFLVDIGDGQTDGADAGFQEVSGIGMEVTVSEYRNGNSKENSVMKITGMNKSTDVTLKRGAIGSLKLYKWLDEIRNGNQGARCGRSRSPCRARTIARRCSPGSYCAPASSNRLSVPSTRRAPMWRWKRWCCPTNGSKWSEAVLQRRLIPGWRVEVPPSDLPDAPRAWTWRCSWASRSGGPVHRPVARRQRRCLCRRVWERRRAGAGQGGGAGPLCRAPVLRAQLLLQWRSARLDRPGVPHRSAGTGLARRRRRDGRRRRGAHLHFSRLIGGRSATDGSGGESGRLGPTR